MRCTHGTRPVLHAIVVVVQSSWLLLPAAIDWSEMHRPGLESNMCAAQGESHHHSHTAVIVFLLLLLILLLLLLLCKSFVMWMWM